MSTHEENVKIGGMNMGRNPLMIVLALFIFIGIPIATFYFNYQKNARTEGDRSEKQIADATARTLLVERHDRDISANTKSVNNNSSSIANILTRMTQLESFKTDAEGRLRRAEETIAQNTDAQKQQRQRALIREGDRKVRDRRISENETRIQEIDITLSNHLNRESEIAGITANELRKEREDLILEVERLKRDLGDAEK